MQKCHHLKKYFGLALLSLVVALSGAQNLKAVDVIDVDVTPVLVAPVPGIAALFGPEEAAIRQELAAACEEAEAIWDERIVGYSTALPNALRLQLTSLRITCEILPLDGFNGTLAQAGPTAILGSSRTMAVGQTDNVLPLAATVTFDVSDLQQLSDAGLLATVAAHEICHAIGFGGFLLDQNQLVAPIVGGVGIRQYVGDFALNTFRQESGETLTGFIPIQQFPGGGIGGHWDLFVPLFNMLDVNNSQELMIPFIDVDNPPDVFITETTFALFADLGYAVTGFNEDTIAPPGTGTGKWPKVIGSNVNPFAQNNPNANPNGLNFALLSGETQAFMSTKEAATKVETGTSTEVDPYNLRNLRWTGRNGSARE